jgi:hypothetical protein
MVYTIHYLFPGGGLPRFSIVEAIKADARADLETAFRAPLAFKIPTLDEELVRVRDDVFQLARSEIAWVLEEKMREVALGSGQSETSVVISDGGWLRIIKLCLGGILVYLNETDPSSMVRLRPDVAV